MNRLSTEGRIRVVACLVEGNSIRATVRLAGVAKNTITRLLVDLGAACSEYQDRVLRDLTCQRLQLDEIWALVYSKAKNVPEPLRGEFGYGDVWTWTAIDADTKLVPSWLVGERTAADAAAFVDDLRSRARGRTQISTEGVRLYLNAVEDALWAEVDYAQIIKLYGNDPDNDKRHSPTVCTGIGVLPRMGDPDPKHISTSCVERQNLTMRMGMRRFTRLTNAFSKKAQNLDAAVSLHFMHYNFARPHLSLKNPYPRTPAMAAGVTDHMWKIEEVVGLLERA